MKQTFKVTYEVEAETEQEAVESILTGGMDYSCQGNLLLHYKDDDGSDLLWVREESVDEVCVFAKAKLKRVLLTAHSRDLHFDIHDVWKEGEEFCCFHYRDKQDALAVVSSIVRKLAQEQGPYPAITEPLTEIPVSATSFPFKQKKTGQETVYVVVTDWADCYWGFSLYTLNGGVPTRLLIPNSRFYVTHNSVYDPAFRGHYVVQDPTDTQLVRTQITNIHSPANLTAADLAWMEKVRDKLLGCREDTPLEIALPLEVLLRDLGVEYCDDPTHFNYMMLT